MARTYRFFARNLAQESMPQKNGQVFNLTVILEPDIFYQLTRVLRAQSGDNVVLIPALQSAAGGARGAVGGKPGGARVYFEYLYKVDVAAKKELALRFEQKIENRNELDFDLGLILCLPNKPDKLEFILQKAVEIGATAVTLVGGDFSQMKHNLRHERLQKIMAEAAEQSERAIIPGLIEAGVLSDYLEKLSQEERRAMAVAMERSSGGENILRGGKKLNILVGPEGGFSEEEKKLINDLALPTFSLGKRVLRMETAAILALGLASMA
jgi:16S rRNA (uracil1498-N3)-methyltransferase